MSEPRPTVCLDVGREIKAQEVRLLDVVLVGPLMVWGGYALGQRGNTIAGTLLGLLGVGTVLYNGRNYARVQRKLRERPK